MSLPLPIPLEHFASISQIIRLAEDWRSALDEIARAVRPYFVLDNLAVYLSDPLERNLEISYARALGRGQKAEADAAWGEEQALRIFRSAETTCISPENHLEEDRLKRPYLLGIPLLRAGKNLGVICFIRFGGPVFDKPSIQFAEIIAAQIALMIQTRGLTQRCEMLEEQTRLVQVQDNFISTITHELRSPLGFIKGYTTTLLRPDTRWDEQTTREFLGIIDHETDQLEELIANLLDSARLQSGQLTMSFEPTRIDSVLHDVLARIHVRHPEAVVEIDCPPDLPLISGDSRRLAQVFENLLVNAVKYAPGAPIRIGAYGQEEDVIVEVIDQGPGIKDEYLPYIFDRFFRVPRNSPNVHGTGLGLFICKQIIQAHHGKIIARSIQGSGTTFLISLPMHTLQFDLE